MATTAATKPTANQPARPSATKRTRAMAHLPVQLEIRTDELPAGVCGRVQGVALTYNTRDAYGTMFAPGCLARTKAEKLAAGKVKLLADHAGDTDCHVGVVRSLDDIGDSVVMSADLFDTEAGREKLEYLKAVTAARAFTGLSIGFYDRASEMQASEPWETPWGSTRDSVLTYTEIELDEISLTPSPAVPGAEVTGARHGARPPREPAALLRIALDTILDTLPEGDVRAAVAARFGADAGATSNSSSTSSTSSSTVADAGNATEPDSDDARERTSPADSDAEAGDSRDASASTDASATSSTTSSTTDAATTDPAALATLDERLRAVRQSYRVG